MEANRILVLYDSLSGNTSKMAEYVAEGAQSIEGIEVRIRSLDDATAEDVVWCDGLAVEPNEHGFALLEDETLLG